MSFQQPKLVLPRRWEILQDKAHRAGVDASDLVERVPAAESRVNQLLSQIDSGSGGVFEIFLGKSGSGKTTFVKSLPRFFDNVTAYSVDKDLDLTTLPAFILKNKDHRKGDYKVFLIEKRDNPSAAEISRARDYFRSWLDFLREPEGNVIILWTMTDENAASTISHQAWDVGRDSLCDSKTEGVYNFGGLDRTNFYRVADNTALNLSGDGLEAYGISENKAQEFLPRSETISDYYQHCVQESEEASGVVWSALKERGQPRLWVLLHGDDRAAIGQTVGSLTQGSHGQIDISRILDTIDDKDNAATYAKQWRKRRANVGQILRSIDTRVFSIPPNVSVHAARCFGDKTVKSALSGKVGSKPAASNSLRATQVYKEILLALGEQPVSAKASGKIAPFTADEYNRIQALAKNNDEKLNEALGRLFDYTLKEDGFNVVVFTEKRSNIIRGLQVDISIKIADNEYICLEPTWRTTSSGTSGQSTLSEGHIKPYLLEKALKYVAALEL